MNNVLQKTVGDSSHGQLKVFLDTEDAVGRPVKLQINGNTNGVWLTPGQVRELRKVLKPFAAPKVAKP